ncbi:NAD(P)-binding domain-containing protein, partial [Halobium palmae]
MTEIGVVGLGYAGLPLALAFAQEGLPVTAYDIDEQRVETLRAGGDPLGDGMKTDEESIAYTADPAELSDCSVVFVSVPTPVSADSEPDTSALRSAGRTVGEHLSHGATV